MNRESIQHRQESGIPHEGGGAVCDRPECGPSPVRTGLLDMVLCFSHALDLLHPVIADHHLRVAYIAASLAESAGLGSGETQDIRFAQRNLRGARALSL